MKRNYLALWLLLSTAFIVIMAISAFGPVNILGHELKDSGIIKALTITESELKKITNTTVDPSWNDIPLSEQPIPVDSTSKRILFFGDSMLDGLYPRLAAYAEENNHELYVVIWYSSTSEVWGRSDKLRGYISKLNPDYIFVSLGANELHVKDIIEKRGKYVDNILHDIGEIPYVWIGPPNWKEDTGINALIASKAGKGNFFLSNGMKFDRKKDGAHPTDASSVLWMDSIARWMPRHSAHPILMEKPKNTKARAKRVYVHQPNEK